MLHLKTWCSYVFPKFSCVEPLAASSGQADQTQIASQTARGGEWKFRVDEWRLMNRWGCSHFWFLVWSSFNMVMLNVIFNMVSSNFTSCKGSGKPMRVRVRDLRHLSGCPKIWNKSRQDTPTQDDGGNTRWQIETTRITDHPNNLWMWMDRANFLSMFNKVLYWFTWDHRAQVRPLANRVEWWMILQEKGQLLALF